MPPTKRVLPHPGTILREEFMVPYDLSANALAAALKVPGNRISAIVHGRRSITADTALRLARYFKSSPEFWLNLQSGHDLTKAQAENGKQILATVKVRDAA